MRVKEKAIENIRNLMEQQELDWLAANGYEPVVHKPEPLRTIPVKKSSVGQLSANRFLGSLESETESEPEIDVEQKAELEPRAEAMPEPEAETMPEPEAEAMPEPEAEPEPEIIEIIKQKEGTPHSWLYNEVVKAIRDAAGDGKNTKVIALIIPVIQNGKEFEDLPVNDTVELSAVDEEAVKTPDLPDDLPENVASEITNATETETEIPIIDDVETEVEALPDEVISEPDEAEQVIDLLPEPMKEPDPELAEAFRDMEAKLDVDTAEDLTTTPDAEVTEDLTTTPDVDVIEDFAAIPDVDATEDPAAIPDVDTTEDFADIPDIEVTDDIAAIPDVDATEDIADIPDVDTTEELVTLPDIDATDDITSLPNIDMTTETDDYIAGQPLKFTELPPLNALDDEEIVDVSEQ